jgi:hypothetical protein
VSSPAYTLFRQAIEQKKQIACTYHGKPRVLCPVILGHTDGQEKALVFQFDGMSERGLPIGGNWRCFFLAEVSSASLGDGPWHTGGSHRTSQTCVAEVAFDVNPDSPYVGRKKR